MTRDRRGGVVGHALAVYNERVMATHSGVDSGGVCSRWLIVGNENRLLVGGKHEHGSFCSRLLSRYDGSFGNEQPMDIHREIFARRIRIWTIKVGIDRQLYAIAAEKAANAK